MNQSDWETAASASPPVLQEMEVRMEKVFM